MVAAYAAAVAGGGNSGPLQSVMSTITVASSSSAEDRSVLKSYSFGLHLYKIIVYNQIPSMVKLIENEM
jgi:hypothetical protein